VSLRGGLRLRILPAQIKTGMARTGGRLARTGSRRLIKSRSLAPEEKPRFLQTAPTFPVRLRTLLSQEYPEYMHQQKVGARAEHRQRESQRIKESPPIAETYPKLKSLTVDLAYCSANGVTKSSQFKYKVNLAKARSMFCFDCLNNECVRGDFDLSADLAQAVAARRKTMSGEKRCPGWLNRTTIGSVHCQNILRYTFSLRY
jgi:hypothetical protein